ncbi:MAG: hypothetical protein AAF353_04665 [Pseudomonadota bacterium]
MLDNQFFKRWVLTIGLLVQVCSAQAEMLPGADEKRFTETVSQWLEDDDAKSLPAFSALAKQGNIAARLLLSRIEVTDRASTAYVKRLSRAERLKLFRSDQGQGEFRSSWLQVEAEKGNPLARGLLNATALGINFDTIKILYDLGEPEASEHLVRKISVDGSSADHLRLSAMLPRNSELTPFLKGFQFSRSGSSTGITALRHMTDTVGAAGPELQTAIRFVDYGYQAGKHAIGDWQGKPYFEAIAQWTLDAPQARPIANLCRQHCNQHQVDACAITALGLVGGYYEVIRFDSPVENIISQDRFLNSKRAKGMISRRIATAATEAGVRVFSDAELTGHSQCLARAVGR